jgi:acyl carrier protein
VAIPTAEEVLNVLCEGLERDPGSLRLESAPSEVPEWTSIAWLSIMSLVDQKYGIVLGAKQISSFQTVEDVVNFLQANAEKL